MGAYTVKAVRRSHDAVRSIVSRNQDYVQLAQFEDSENSDGSPARASISTRAHRLFDIFRSGASVRTQSSGDPQSAFTSGFSPECPASISEKVRCNSSRQYYAPKQAISGGCWCLWCCLSIFSAEFLASMVWLLIVSPETLRWTPSLPDLGFSACQSANGADGTRWPAHKRDWCCKAHSVGCKPYYVSMGRFLMVQGVAFAGIVALPFMAFVAGCLLQGPVHNFMESMEKDVLGVAVSFAGFAVDLCCGTVRLEGLVVGNPEGFKAPHLLSIGKLIFDIDVFKFIRSFGKVVSVQRLVLHDVSVIVEQKGFTTNASKLIQSFGEDSDDSDDDHSGKRRSQRKKWWLHEVAVVHSVVRIQLDALGGLGKNISLNDVVVKDLNREEALAAGKPDNNNEFGCPGFSAARLSRIMLKRLLLPAMNTSGFG